MADIISYIVQILVLILVLISTIFTQKGFSNSNKWFDAISTMIKNIDVQGVEPKKCKKCGKLIEEHTIKEAKKCGLLSEK